jgi:hypothetical protein
MRNLLDSSDRLAAARRQGQVNRSSLPVPRKIGDFWRHAQRLHTALSKAWQCDCLTHITNLGLEHRTSEKLEFDVFFDLVVAGLRLTKIKVVGKDDGTNQHTTQRTVSPDPRSQRQVRFKSPISLPQTDSAQNLTPIYDLCGSLSTDCAGCLGFLEEDEHRFMVYPEAQVLPAVHASTKTLGDLLASTEVLTRRKRYGLALTLASSYLQLGATPWLNPQLRTDNIVFLQDPCDPTVTSIDHPYIRREISKNNNKSTSTEGLPSLGIRLLELCFGKSLEATSFRKQLPAGDPTSAPILDFAAAIQWSKQAGEEAGPEFADAIDWCLHAKERSDGSWRKDFLQNVVAPLYSCHKQVSQKPPSV